MSSTAGWVVWLTGVSGAGKSSLACSLAAELRARGRHVLLLDGDEVRKVLSHGLGFSEAERAVHLRRLAWVAASFASADGVAIVAAISPTRASRSEARSLAPRFFELHCHAELEILCKRDPKGLYQRALRGELRDFAGVNSPYEAPEAPELSLNTGELDLETCRQELLSALETRGLFRTQAQRSLLAPPYGGDLRCLPCRELEGALPEDSGEVPQLELSPSETETFALLARSWLSPITGFPSPQEQTLLTHEGRLESGLPWPDFPPAPNYRRALTSPQVNLSHQGQLLGRVLLAPGQTLNEERPLAGAIEFFNRLEGSLPTASELRTRLEEVQAGRVLAVFVNTKGERLEELKACLRLLLVAADVILLLGVVTPNFQDPAVWELPLGKSWLEPSRAHFWPIIAANLGAHRWMSSDELLALREPPEHQQ